MRLDKFLKMARLVKRRTVAQEMVEVFPDHLEAMQNTVEIANWHGVQ